MHQGHGSGEHAGHDKHAGHSVAMFRDRFWLSLLLTIPVLVWSEMVQEWLGYTAPSFPLSVRIPAILGTVIFVYGGMPFLKGGVQELRDRQPGMMLLISLAIVVAFVASLASEIDWLDLEFWWELALLIDVMLLGHWQEMKAIGQASGALEALAALLPDEAEVAHGDEVHTVAASELRPGDVVLVRPGGRVPADGMVVEGDASFDESMITGESRTVRRSSGDRVVAGTVATDNSVRIEVEAVGDETALAGIQRLVREAQASRSRAQALADRAAAMLFYIAVAAGALTFVVWAAIGETGEAVERTVTVLVISCPHALGLAIPLVIAISTGIAARTGILVRDRLALERMRTRRRGPVRQDRDPDEGKTGRPRHNGRRRSGRGGAPRRRRGREEQRASTREGDRLRGDPQWWDPERVGLPGAAGAWRRSRRRRNAGRGRRPGAASGTSDRRADRDRR